MNKANRESLSKLADAAFQQAAAQVIEQAKKSGTPVIVWEDGRVKAVPSKELEPRIRRSTRKRARPKHQVKD